MLFRGEFEVKAVGPKQVAGRLSTPSPIQDAPINKPIRYDVTFAADVRGATGK